MNPIITAWLRLQECRDLGILPRSPYYTQWLGMIDEARREYNDLVASVSVPKFSVGFFKPSIYGRYFMVRIWDNTFFNSPVANLARYLGNTAEEIFLNNTSNIELP